MALSSRRSPRISGIKEIKNYQGNVNTIKIRAVCRSCNHGWMGDKEQAAKPILSRLLMGEAADLGTPEQRVIATWLAMKFMVCEFGNPDAVSIPYSEREYLRLRLEPPPNWRVWIAPYQGQNWRTGYNRFSATLGTLDETGTPIPPNRSLAKNTQFSSLGIGRLFAAAFSSTVPGLTFQMPPKAAFFLRCIWPTGGTIPWLPALAIDDAGAEHIANTVMRASSRLRWASSD